MRVDGTFPLRTPVQQPWNPAFEPRPLFMPGDVIWNGIVLREGEWRWAGPFDGWRFS